MPRGVRAGLAAIFVVVSLPTAALGQEADPGGNPWASQRRLDEERSRVAKQYDESLALESDLVAAWEVSRAVVDRLQVEITRIDERLTATSARLRAAELRYDDARVSARMTASRAADARVRVGQSREVLRASAIAAYVSSSDLTGLAGWGRLVENDDLVLSMFYARHLNRLREERVRDYLDREDEAERRAATADQARQQAASARNRVDRQRGELQQLRDGRAAARQTAEVEVARQADLVAQVRARAADYEDRLQTLEAESERIGELIRRAEARKAAEQAAWSAALAGGATAAATGSGAGRTGLVTSVPRSGRPRPAPRPAPATTAAPSPRPSPRPTAPAATTAPTAPRTTNNAGSGPPPRTGVSLRYPLPGWPVVSGYGWRVHPILGVRKLHEGIDIWAPMGQPIQAAGSGAVIWAGPRHGFGNCIVIDHGSSVSTLYAHLSAISVGVGQHVSAGQTIGNVGSTGLANGPHLHFEVRVGGRSYDPLAYVNAR